MTRAFITGISGQDGSYLADAMVAQGAEVHGLIRGRDDDTNALVARHPSVVLHEGDLANHAELSALIHDVAPDEIYNFAGVSSVALSWEIPVVTAEVTGVAVTAILESALELSRGRAAPVRVLQASSSEIFGEPTDSPQDESTRISPTSPYGAAKAYAHNMVKLYRSRGLPVSSCILYNHESPRRPETFVTRKITAAAARIAAGLQSTLELGALDVERDWGWAPDYVEAMMLAIRHDPADDYVIATGQSHTVRDFVIAAFAAAGIDDWEEHVRVNPKFVRAAEITAMRGNSSKARAVLGWEPTTNFATLVELMVNDDIKRVRAGDGSVVRADS